MPPPPPPLDPAAAFAELGRIKLGEVSLDEVLQRVAELARRTLPGASEVSVTLVRDGAPRTAAFTGKLALDLDELQYERGHGPCLDASESVTVMAMDDVDQETRWPDWTPRAAAAGARSSLSVGLPVQDRVTGALNLYSVDREAFDEDAVALAKTFAGYAAVALANAQLYDATATLARQMQTAMESRAVVEQAKGILMGRHRCTADEAFSLLTRMSQDSGRKLRDVAETMVAEAQS